MFSQRSEKTLTPHLTPGASLENISSMRNPSDLQGLESTSKVNPVTGNSSKRTVLSRTIMNNTDDIKVFTRSADGQMIEQAKMGSGENIFKSLGIETMNVITDE